jgi:pyruvate dehydrogenase E1 component beta subunit
MDYDTILKSVRKTNRLVVPRSSTFASVASEITYIVQERAFDFLDALSKELHCRHPAPLPVLLKEGYQMDDV